MQQQQQQLAAPPQLQEQQPGLIMAQQPPLSANYIYRPLFRRIRYRNAAFIVGLWGLLVSTLLFIAGQAGLYFFCDCSPHWSSFPSSIFGVLAVDGFILSLLLAFYQEIWKHPPLSDIKGVELTGAGAGLLGLLDIAISAIIHDAAADDEARHNYLHFWGFWLAAFGSALGTLSSIMVAGSRVLHADDMNRALAELGVYPLPPVAPVTIFFRRPAFCSAVPAQAPLAPPVVVCYAPYAPAEK